MPSVSRSFFVLVSEASFISSEMFEFKEAHWRKRYSVSFKDGYLSKSVGFCSMLRTAVEKLTLLYFQLILKRYIFLKT